MKDAKGHGSDSRSGGLPVVRLDAVGSRQPKTGYLAAAQPKVGRPATSKDPGVPSGGSLSSAAAETLASQRAADESHYPTSTVTDRMAAMALGQSHPKSNEVPLGSSFAAAKSALWFGRNVAMARGADNRRKS